MPSVKGYLSDNEYKRFIELTQENAINISSFIRRAVRNFIRDKECEAIMKGAGVDHDTTIVMQNPTDKSSKRRKK